MLTSATGAAAYVPPTALTNGAGIAENITDPATLEAELAKQAALTAEAGGLTDVQLRKLASSLQGLNAGLTSLSDENGATAISLPTVETPTDMGALSTADLLQIIRAEVAKTTALLTSATIQAIKAQKEGIEARRAENTAKIEESIKKAAEAAEKAEKAKALNLALQIFGGIAIAIMLVMGAVTGGTTAVIAIAMAAMFVTMTCMTEIKNSDGDSGMDLMGKSCAKTFYSHLSPEEAEKKGAELAGGIMMAIQAVVCIACIWAAAGPGAATLGKFLAQKAPGMAIDAAAKTLGMTASSVTTAAARAGAVVQIAQGATGVAAGVVSLQSAELQYDADIASAEVTKLKSLIKMLETLLQGDTEFIQMLMELQAKMDAAVAEIVTDETVSNEATDLHNPVMG